MPSSRLILNHPELRCLTLCVSGSCDGCFELMSVVDKRITLGNHLLQSKPWMCLLHVFLERMHAQVSHGIDGSAPEQLPFTELPVGSSFQAPPSRSLR